MKKTLSSTALLVNLLLTLSSALLADDAIKHYYVGGGIGSTIFSNDDPDEELKDGTDIGYKFYAGYNFNKIIGVEASYTDYGTKFTYFSGRYIEATAIGVGANAGYSFFDEQFRPFVILGVSSLSINQGDNISNEHDRTTSISYNLGVEYNPRVLNGLGFRSAWSADFFFMPESFLTDKKLMGSVGIFSLSAHYKF